MKQEVAKTHWWLRWMPATKQDIKEVKELIMAKVSGLEARFEAVLTLLGTILTEIQTLKGQLGDADIPTDAEATLERLETAAKAAADAGAPTTPPTPSPGAPTPPTA